MSDVDRRIEGLSPEKRALLEQRLLQQRRRTRTDDGIPKRDRGRPCPLSFSQQRLWFLDQWDPGAPTYNAVLPLLVRGRLDHELLTRALSAVVKRHEALRTVFRGGGGEPEQVVLDSWELDVPVIDLSDVPVTEREARLHAEIRERARRPFDLANDLMLRASLFRLAEDEHVLSFEEHHIAFDGWSDAILFSELEELYAAELEGREPKLPDLAIQYGDFAVWQRDRMQGPLLAEHQAYWRQRLAGAPNQLRLPTDLQRPDVQRFEGEHYFFSMPATHADGVRALSREEGATPFMVLLALFTAVLYRVTGQDDILVGSPIANRSKVELEPLIGFFSNTLVYRTQLAGNPSFRELIRRVRESALGAYQHQDLPFEKVVEAVRPTRDPRVNPLFQVNFRVTSGPATTLALPGVAISSLQVDIGFSRFDLAAELQLRDAEIQGYVEYNTALFERSTAERIAQQLEALLGDALTRPDTPLLSLELGGEDERPAQRRASIRSFRERGAVPTTSEPTTIS
jgi:Condensation domain